MPWRNCAREPIEEVGAHGEHDAQRLRVKHHHRARRIGEAGEDGCQRDARGDAGLALVHEFMPDAVIVNGVPL